MPYTYEYPRPAVTADALVFRYNRGRIDIVLIKRDRYPHEGMWALPGGFVDMDEPLEAAAARELKEEAGIRVGNLTQLRAYGEPDRDPRTRIVAVAFYGYAEPGDTELRAGDDARDAQWRPVSALPEMAFDHDVIISDALDAIRRDACFGLGHCAMLGERFSREDFAILTSCIFGGKFDAEDIFEKLVKSGKILSAGDDSSCFFLA